MSEQLETDDTTIIADVAEGTQDDLDPATVLYTYGVEQNLGRKSKVQILFMFAHEVNRLIVVNIHYDRGNIDVRAFATPFNPKKTVHVILEPYISQIGEDVRAMTELELTDVWGWLPGSIVEYYEGDSDLCKIAIEDDPTEVPGSLDEEEYMAFVEFGIYAQELSSEFLEDLFEA